MSKKDDLYIAIMKFGDNHIENGTSLNQLQEHLTQKQYTVTEQRLRKLFCEMFDPLDAIGCSGKPEEWAIAGNRFTLTVDSKFNLLEYVELQEARQSSRRAMLAAILAIGISIITGFFSIHYSQKQLETPTTIDSTQFEIIKGLKFNYSVLDSNLLIITQKQDALIDLLYKKEEKEKPKTSTNNK